MALTVTYSKSAVFNGVSYGVAPTVAPELAIPFDVELAAAKSGTLSTRTDNNTGELTMSGGHGITTGVRLDLYWSGGSRRGMTVGTVSGNAVPIDGGAGDNLPIATTAVTAAVPDEEEFLVTGDNVVGILLKATSGGTIVFADASDVELAAVVLTTTTQAYTWFSADGGTNPLAGDDVAKVFLSHGSTSAATVGGAVLYS